VPFTLDRRFVFAPSDGYAHGLSSHGRRCRFLGRFVFR
jgi:hypothetical protein